MSMSKKPQSTQDKPSFFDDLSKNLDHMSSKNVQVGLLAALLISAVSVVVMNLFGGVEQFRTFITSAGPLAPLAFIALKASTYVIAPLSGTPVKLAAGALFGFWEGALYALVGDMVGASMNFWIARLFRVKAIARLSGKGALKQIDETTQHVGGWKALLAARLFLSSLYDFVSYAAGLSNLPFRQFFVITLFAGIPSTLMASWLGDSIATNQSLFFGLVGLGVLSVMLILVSNKWLNKSSKK